MEIPGLFDRNPKADCHYVIAELRRVPLSVRRSGAV